MATTVDLHKQRQTLKDGSVRIYLSKRYTTKGQKKRPVVPFGKWIYDKPKSSEQKTHNKDTLAFCERILKSEQNKLDIDANGLVDLQRSEMPFLKAYDQFVADKGKRWGRSERNNQKRMIDLLTEFAPSLTVKQITPDFSQRFYNFIYEQKNRGGDVKISANTANAYFSKFNYIADYFWRSGLLTKDPSLGVRKETDEKEQAPHLNEDELKVAVGTPMKEQRDEPIRRAFLFSCFTGLRLGDLSALRYSDVKKELDGTYYVETTMEKTKKKIKIPLNDNALEMVGELRDGSERVFKGINGSAHQYKKLKYWAIIQCGVPKEITFHSGRHTFAYRYYRLTRDIVALQHLLGHANLATTQIYAKHSTEDSKADILNMPKL